MPYSVGQNHPPTLSPRNPDVRAPSPNYFGLAVEPANNSDPRESSGLPRETWSPPSSSVKSFAAAIPKQVPLDANPEFEAFRRQADLNRGKSFALSSSQYAVPTPGLGPSRPRPPQRWNTHASDHASEAHSLRSPNAARERPPMRMDLDQENNHDSAYVSSDSRGNSETSLNPFNIPNLPRFESPNPMDSSQMRTSLTRAEDRDPRLSLMEHRADPPAPRVTDVRRSATVPPKLEAGQPNMITGEELRDLLDNVDEERLLMLDIRSSQNYAHSRITGALNLCIPTTLLKRATFNIAKLQQTFSQGVKAEKFSSWKDMEYIVVYDAHSSDKRDAITAQNMIKKFTNEGFAGVTCILRGGFNSFQQPFSDYVDRRSGVEMAGKSGPLGGGLAPVIGGVMLPTATNDVNPFFSNIRQNMDLADGVGQQDVSRPPLLDSPSLPTWLREAASKADHGKKVSSKFLHIEVDEQSRMRSAYAAFNPNNHNQSKVQLCGVEKGGKNRYKDILPFEHARVKLQAKNEGGCDYVNASHLKASRSNKRYIATQGPLPATFEVRQFPLLLQDQTNILRTSGRSFGIKMFVSSSC